MAEVTHREKLKQLILFIAEQGANDPALGSVKLNKIMYFADTRAYLQLHSPITGATYLHLPEGPAPEDRPALMRELIDEGAIEFESIWSLNRRQQRIKALKPPNLTLFNEAELRIVREIMDCLADLSADEAAELSRRDWGWRLTSDFEAIPYRMAWLSAQPLTQEQIEHGKQAWAELGGRRG
jgi:hypothetical protein